MRGEDFTPLDDLRESDAVENGPDQTDWDFDPSGTAALDGPEIPWP